MTSLKSASSGNALTWNPRPRMSAARPPEGAQHRSSQSEGTPVSAAEAVAANPLAWRLADRVAGPLARSSLDSGKSHADDDQAQTRYLKRIEYFAKNNDRQHSPFHRSHPSCDLAEAPVRRRHESPHQLRHASDGGSGVTAPADGQVVGLAQFWLDQPGL